MAEMLLGCSALIVGGSIFILSMCGIVIAGRLEGVVPFTGDAWGTTIGWGGEECIEVASTDPFVCSDGVGGNEGGRMPPLEDIRICGTVPGGGTFLSCCWAEMEVFPEAEIGRMPLGGGMLVGPGA